MRFSRRGVSQILAMGAQAVGNGVAEEVAHGVSRVEQSVITKSPISRDRIAAKENCLSPLCGSDCKSDNPRLTPWAIFYRCSAANCRRSEKRICALGFG